MQSHTYTCVCMKTKIINVIFNVISFVCMKEYAFKYTLLTYIYIYEMNPTLGSKKEYPIDKRNQDGQQSKKLID